MSKIALSGDASGTGTFTIASPNSNNNRTLTLPDNTGTVLTTGSTFAGTGPAFSVVKGGSGQAISSNVFTKVTYQTVEFDTNSNWDAVNNRFTPNVAGYYQFNWSGSLETTAANAGYTFMLYKNNTVLITAQYFWASATGGNGAGMQGNGLIFLNGTTDYAEIFAVSNNTNSLNSGNNNRFSGVLVRAA